MDEQTDMERNAKRTSQEEREDMERYKESSAQVLVLSEKERERLVITHTDREEDKGRDAAVLCKDEAAGKNEITHSFNSHTLIHK